MDLAALTRIHKTEVVAERAGVTVNSVYVLRSGSTYSPMFIAASTITAFCDLYDIEGDVEGVLRTAAPFSAEVRQLLQIKDAYPDLDLLATMQNMLACRDWREAKKAAGYVETRGGGS